MVEVSNYVYQTSHQFAQITLRSVLGEVELDELLAHRDKINMRLQSIRDTQLLGRLPVLSTYRQLSTSRGPEFGGV